MGLQVTFYYGAKIHQCEDKKETGQVISMWEHKTEDKGCLFNIKNLEVIELFNELTFKAYECPHLEDGANVMTLNPGYNCFVANGFVPGEIVEYSIHDGFYYGSYAAWWRDVSNLPALFNKYLSDCAGYYTGYRLRHIRNAMAKYKDEKSASFNEYFEFLEETSEDSFLTSTIVVHH